MRVTSAEGNIKTGRYRSACAETTKGRAGGKTAPAKDAAGGRSFEENGLFSAPYEEAERQIPACGRVGQEQAGAACGREGEGQAQAGPVYGRDGQVQAAAPAVDRVYGRAEMDDFIRRQLKSLGDIRAEIGRLPADRESLHVYLEQLGEGLHMGIPSDMADWMCEGRPAFLEGMRMIRDASAVLQEERAAGAGSAGMLFGQNDEDLYWVRNMLDRLEESRKKQKEYYRKLSVMKLKKKLNYHMGRDMARLAQRRTDKEVRSLISGVYARRAGVLGSSVYGAKEKAAAQRQMDYVITCARTKIRQLKEEGLVEGRKKRAEMERRLKEYRQLEKELKERRLKRKAAEHARIFERMPDLPGLRDQEERREALEESLLHVGTEAPSLDLQLVDVPAQSGLGSAGQVDELASVTV